MLVQGDCRLRQAPGQRKVAKPCLKLNRQAFRHAWPGGSQSHRALSSTSPNPVMAGVRPRMPDGDRLLATLRWCGEQFNARTGFPFTVTYDTQPGPSELARLLGRVERALFRTAPEALTNAAWH
jgi:hypothetical protein